MNERFYRDLHSKALDSFTVSIDETDLWIGVKPYHVGMEKFCHDLVKKLRMNIKTYISEKPEFLTSLVPVEFDEGAPEIVKEMITAGKRAMVGPMASVAGAISQEIGFRLIDEYKVEDVIIENGGDIFLSASHPFDVAIYAGTSPLSMKFSITIPSEFLPCGVCTSSGTVGHSLSFGKADAVMVAHKNTSVADAFATKLANRVKTKDDIQDVLRLGKKYDLLSVVIIKDDVLGLMGNFKVKPILL